MVCFEKLDMIQDKIDHRYWGFQIPGSLLNNRFQFIVLSFSEQFTSERHVSIGPRTQHINAVHYCLSGSVLKAEDPNIWLQLF
jgi:hypothetical protein